MRLLGWLLIGCSVKGNKFCVLRCCWLTIWLQFSFQWYVGEQIVSAVHVLLAGFVRERQAG
jgi:hypothetical protein